MTTKQSKQTPMPQKSPRGLSLMRVSRNIRAPLFKIAAAKVWPYAAFRSLPSKVKVTLFAGGITEFMPIWQISAAKRVWHP